METEEIEIKQHNYKSLIIILFIVILIAIIIYIVKLITSQTVLEVEAPTVVFVGDTDNLKVTSNKNIYVTTKNGYISSDKKYYEDNNPNVLLTAIKSGHEEITIKSDNKVKTIEILVCDTINLNNNSFDINLDESFELNFNIDSECLSNYNISIQDSSIANYQDGKIYGQKPGTTLLTISRKNENTNYNINVIDKELYFNLSKNELNIGEELDIPLINARGSYTCNANNNLVEINNSNTGCHIKAIKEGTEIITANDGTRTAQIEIKIINPYVEVENIIFNKNVIRITKGNSYNLDIQITPSNATNQNITYTSKNPETVSVLNGVVSALEYGTTTIEAKTNNGKKATISIIVTGDDLLDSYESNTLNYWIENRGANYVLTNIWVKDAYSQFKMAITSPQKNDSPTPRTPQDGKTIIQNEINAKNYQNKGLVSINASAMVSSQYGTYTPASWYGTSQIPLILYEGQVIRNSAHQYMNTDQDYIIYGLKKNGELAYYNYYKGATTEEKNKNHDIVDTIISDGVLYTFGFQPVLLSDGNVLPTSNSANIRQAICQVDKNNFIFITNTNSTDQRNLGFGFKDLAEEFKKLNCKTALNLDGGGSTCEFYKDNTSDLKKVRTAYGNRLLSDMIYFVEK